MSSIFDILAKLADGQVLQRVGKRLVGVDLPSAGPSLATTGTPAALGSASRGTDTTAARSDHVHPTTGVVTTSGAQSVAGAKTFTDTPVMQAGVNMYSTQITNLGPPSGANDAVPRDFQAPVRFYSRTVAQLAGIASPADGDVVYVSNGRKPGEGSGVGTGVLARYNGTAWRSLLEDATVAA